MKLNNRLFQFSFFLNRKSKEKFNVIINGKSETLFFGSDGRVPYPIFPWGTFDVIGKRHRRSKKIEILSQNSAVVFIKKGNEEPYVATVNNSGDQRKVCLISDLRELKSLK